MSTPRTARLEIRPSPAWRAALIGLVLLAAATLGAWLHGHELPLSLVLGLPLALALALLGRPARLLGPERPTVLAWDGRQWSVSPEGQALKVQPMLDLGDAMLLRMKQPGGGMLGHRWWALQRSRCAGDWAAFRAALYSARLEGPLSDGGAAPPPDRLP